MENNNKKLSTTKTDKNKTTQKFKSQYFEYYDDIKSHTHDVFDW